ncbi:pentatricopeptide repeat-containing protein At2g44880 [Eutrema salsugineum]|uniref:pentatricopeptide repeat-containing protein At2g44880 n=1 Tax=Eutrema salsugineum TaxID=72664 RepID=UPI000CED211B|nr:pentatricopeptide repeat-containing protein At2g44880 [Eutrema salsugineum]
MEHQGSGVMNIVAGFSRKKMSCFGCSKPKLKIPSTELVVCIKMKKKMMQHERETQPLWLPFERKCFDFLQQSPRLGRFSLLQIHAFMLRHAIDTNVQIFTKFLVVSASAVGITHARKLFDQRPQREDSFLCNSMIKAYLDTRQYPDSFALYRDLRKETCFAPDNFTFTTLTKSCTLSMCVYQGLQLHGQIWRSGFCADMYVSTGVVDMYAKFGKMGCARNVFDEMPQRSEVSWTALICGYARCGELQVASKLFDEMPQVKDVVICNAMMDGYVKSGDMTSARRLFDEMTDKTVITWTTMIRGYCNNRDIESARELFDAMPQRNLVSWNTMIGGYCQNKQPQEAIRLFQEMQATTSLEPDDVTVVSVLPAISDTGALSLGEWCHHFVQRKKLDKMVKVCTAILDMYSKCGEIEKARKIFDEMPEKEVASWNAMIHGSALNGNARAALDLFLAMLKEVKPDEVTMLAVLSACNHGGLVEKGRKWFRVMEEFGLIAKIEHYGCMVDLLGRAGHLKEAEDVITNMPFVPNGIILSSFLSACGQYKDIERAERILNKAVELEPQNDGNYVLLRNLYAADKRWDDVGMVKRMMKKNEAKKEVGCSTIEINSIVSEFISGDTTHPHRRNIHLVLGKVLMHMKDEETNW